MVNLKTHGIIDYLVGAILIVAPYIFGFSDVESGRNTFLILGAGLIVYSLLTRYPLSIVKLIPLGAHMVLDVLAGAFLIIAPYFLGYRASITSGQEVLHWVLALAVFGLVAFTQPKTEREKIGMPAHSY